MPHRSIPRYSMIGRITVAYNRRTSCLVFQRQDVSVVLKSSLGKTFAQIVWTYYHHLMISLYCAIQQTRANETRLPVLTFLFLQVFRPTVFAINASWKWLLACSHLYHTFKELSFPDIVHEYTIHRPTYTTYLCYCVYRQVSTSTEALSTKTRRKKLGHTLSHASM